MRKIYLFYLMSLLVVGGCRCDDVYMASQMSLNESGPPEAATSSVVNCEINNFSENNEILTYSLW